VAAFLAFAQAYRRWRLCLHNERHPFTIGLDDQHRRFSRALRYRLLLIIRVHSGGICENLVLHHPAGEPQAQKTFDDVANLVIDAVNAQIGRYFAEHIRVAIFPKAQGRIQGTRTARPHLVEVRPPDGQFPKDGHIVALGVPMVGQADPSNCGEGLARTLLRAQGKEQQQQVMSQL